MNVNDFWLVSAICLSVTIAVCIYALVGCFRYTLNFLQYVGLLGIMLGSIPRVHLLILTQSFDGRDMPPAAQLFVHVGIGCFAVGFAWRAWWYRRHNRRALLWR